ncbi:MAG: site-specific DNA-methyltransferase [Actinomycetota bacterium]
MTEKTTRRSTETASFGTGARESHDSSAFYARFVPPVTTDDETVVHPKDRPASDLVALGTAQRVLADDRVVADNSVALVVTSPPYFVGKAYEEAMGQGHVPEEYGEHLDILHEVFAHCVRKLEPGGRIAVNVANLGRKPYRSQAADVLRIFEDLGLLLRGEIIWKKGKGMGSSTAWGSFQKASNPVLRDLTERVIVASKGRWDRAVSARRRKEMGLPCEGSIFKEEFMEATYDVWEIPPESATRVGHPAPFPVELPKRLIDLYTYYDDLVLDPFMGAGTTAVAAVRTGRSFIGCETEQEYIDLSNHRVAEEHERAERRRVEGRSLQVVIPAVKALGDDDPNLDPQERAVREGIKAEDLARLVLEECGFTSVTEKKTKLRCGVQIDITAASQDGQLWHFDVTGTFTSERDGLRRTDTLWKSLGKAAARATDAAAENVPYVLLTTSKPAAGEAWRALQACQQGPDRVIFDAIEMLSPEGQERLRGYASEGREAAAGTPEPMTAAEADTPF